MTEENKPLQDEEQATNAEVETNTEAQAETQETAEPTKPKQEEAAEVIAETEAETTAEVTEVVEEVIETIAEPIAEEVAETIAVEVEVAPEATPAPIVAAGPRDTKDIVPLEDFDWGAFGKKQDRYNDSDRAQMEEDYTKTLTSIAEHEIIPGTIVAKTKKEVVVNIGYKSEGVVSLSEFRYNPDVKIGDQIEVYVENTEDKTGQLIISHKKARTLKAWDRINDSLDKSEIIKGFVKCRTKGGLIVDVFGIEAFLPGSQIDVKPIKDYDVYVGKTMEFKVVKINHEFKNVVVSHKALIEAEIEEQKKEIISRLEKGQVLEGVVKNVTSYGVFIDLGGVDGLIHITDLSWGRINHPEEVVQVDQKINVVILDFDDDKKRIALGLKQLSPHPWDGLDENLQVGDKVKGKVVVLADYGAFVEVGEGVEGLIHVSEMSWSQHLRTAQDFFSVGDEVEAVIMTLDREERKMSLSTRRLTQDPWEGIEAKYPNNSRHKGKVTNLSNFGVFVEMEEGIDGLIHISDLSWAKKINHPAEFTKVGEEIEVVILEIDKENKKLSLGHKQLEENPWEVFETVFTEGSEHEGTVISMVDKGAIIALPYGVEGYAPVKHLMKEDGKKAKVDDTLTFVVLEFNKDLKKIMLSHSKVHEANKAEETEKEEKAKTSKEKATRKAVKAISENQEKTTLGDIEALSSLKEAMDAGTAKAAKKKAAKDE